jgi:hypothetical protein
MRGSGAAAVASESNMGEGQVRNKVSRHIYVFSVGTNDIHRFGLGRASVGTVGRKGGYAS